MSVLPLQIAEKRNSPELEAWLSQFGSEYYLEAQEINNIISGINELWTSNPDNSDKVVFLPADPFNLDPGAMRITLKQLIKWRIGGLFFQNDLSINLAVDPAADGKKRKDIVVGTTANFFQIVKGDEDDTLAMEPDAPEGTVKITSYDVNGSILGNIELPNLGSEFVKKMYYGEVQVTGSGSNLIIDLDSNGRNTYTFTTAPDSLKGFSYELGYQHLFNGKTFFLKNAAESAIQLLQSNELVPNRLFFNFSYKIQPGELIMLRTSLSGGLEFVGTSFAATIQSLASKEDLILEINPQPGINYTAQATDCKKRTVFSNSNPVSYIIPNNSATPIPIGTKLEYIQQGDGNVQVSGSGVTFVSNLPLTSVKGETRILRKIATDTWALSGSGSTDALTGGVIFVSNSSGDDTTAKIENRNKPYKTLNAAIAAYWSNPNIDYIEIIDTSSYTISVNLNNGTIRKLDIRSQKACAITNTTSAVYGFNNQEIKFDCPYATLNFSPMTTGLAGFGNSSVTINATAVVFNSNWSAVGGGNFNPVTINSTSLTLNGTTSGIVSATGGSRIVTVKTKTINFRGNGTVLFGSFISGNLDFDQLTHDGTFSINSGSATVINHGSISSVSPYTNATNVNYITGGNTSIVYKTGSTISSNISINMFNAGGKLFLTGVVTYQNSDRVIFGHNSSSASVDITNAVVNCKLLFGYRCKSTFTITNSVFQITGSNFGSADQSGSGITYDTPCVRFVGANFIIGVTNGFNIYQHDTSWTHTNKPSVEIKKGFLQTNGKFNKTYIDLTESPLNEYNARFLPTYVDDVAAASGGVAIGETYIEISTGYHKNRLI